MFHHDYCRPLRASRALIGIDQRILAEAAGLSLPTIQRWRRGGRDRRQRQFADVSYVAALDALGIELISDDAPSHGGGRGIQEIRGRRS